MEKEIYKDRMIPCGNHKIMYNYQIVNGISELMDISFFTGIGVKNKDKYQTPEYQELLE